MKTEIYKIKSLLFTGICSIALLIAPGVAMAQNEPVRNFPQEKVYLHANSTLLFSGDYLFYKFYCLNQPENTLSQISKAGWVELIDGEGNTVFRHKLKLENGQANSHFFVPVSLPSGSYKLVAYTNWMTNLRNNYFSQDVFLINPYLKNSGDLGISKYPTVVLNKQEFIGNGSLGNLTLEVNKKKFSPREKVVLNLHNQLQSEASLSLSVRKLDSITKPERYTATNFSEQFQNLTKATGEIVLPELRGTLISGRVSENNLDELINQSVILSFPGEEALTRISRIDEEGKFLFNLDETIYGEKVFLQILGKEGDYRIKLDEIPKPDFSQLTFSEPVLNSSLEQSIINRSLDNQIENAYSQVKVGDYILKKDIPSLFGDRVLVFNLNDYNRFSDVQKTFVEVIQYAGIRKFAGKNVISVRSKNPLMEFNNPALVIVDGVVVQDHQRLISYDANKISSIGVVRDKYFLGPEVFDGIVIVRTNEGDFPVEFQQNNLISTEITIPQMPANFYSVDYSQGDFSRIPDYRNQLIWAPAIYLGTKSEEISFYTSDVAGIFEIVLEGFTTKGIPISFKEIIVVE